MTVAHAGLRERVLEANRAIVRAGLVALTFGNASELDRDAGVMAIKPSGVPYDDLDAASMVVVDVESGQVVDGDLRPSSDTPTHVVLYQRLSGVGGIVHTHSVAATAWAQARRPIPSLGTTHADHFDGAVPVTREMTDEEIGGEYEARTGDVIAETFAAGGLEAAATPGVLVASHAPFAFGVDAADAVENAIALEYVAELALRTLAIRPECPPMGRTLAQRHHQRKHGPSAYYGQPVDGRGGTT